MGINVNFHFRLPAKSTTALLSDLGFKAKRSLWALKGTEGVFEWTAGKQGPTLKWDAFVRFDDLTDEDVQAALLEAVKSLGKRLDASAVACLPDTTQSAKRSDYLPFTRLTAKKLFASANALTDSIPDDIREMLGLD